MILVTSVESFAPWRGRLLVVTLDADARLVLLHVRVRASKHKRRGGLLLLLSTRRRIALEIVGVV